MIVNAKATGNDSVAVTGTASAGQRTIGVKGIGDSVGVHGEGKAWHGVEGISDSTIGGFGVFGVNTAGGTGVVGESKGWMGVYGRSESTTGGAGVMGEAVGPGIIGKSQTWMGVYGESQSTTGGAGVWGENKGDGHGVVGIGKGKGAGIYGKGGRVAGFFEGDVEVTGDIRLTNADCAEDFNIGMNASVEPGTVMVLGEEGALFPSRRAYDKRVAGVVSGAGDYRPGIVLDKQQSKGSRQPLALLGKVYCKVTAEYGAIEVGDLLSTSSMVGHAVKASDPAKAFGSVIGKALRPIKEGQGLIPILIALQ
jgi:hypothetical protein